jgi:hypothetical protein
MFFEEDGPNELVKIEWDFGYRAIDIVYNGQLLVRLTDATPLRSTGMQGQAPDGSTLFIRIIQRAQEEFEVFRNGELLDSKPPTLFTQGSSTPETKTVYEVDQLLKSLTTRHDEKTERTMKSQVSKTRAWMVMMSVLSAGMSAFLFYFSLNQRISTRATLRTSAVSAAITAVLYLALALISWGRLAGPVFFTAMVAGLINSLYNFAHNSQNSATAIAVLGISLISLRTLWKGWEAAGQLGKLQQKMAVLETPPIEQMAA